MTHDPRKETGQGIALAHDALQTVRRCPEHIPLWWRLIQLLKSLSGEHIQQITDLVAGLETPTAQGHWLKHSALWRLTGDARHLASMAQAAVHLPDPDRWMALAMLVWHNALNQAPDRTAFRQLFIDTRQVELLGRLGQALPRAPRPARSAPPADALQRVAIVASHLSIGTHAGTGLTFDLRAALEHVGVDTQVFSAQELSLPTMGTYFAGQDSSAVAAAQPAGWRLRTPGQARISLASTDFSLGSRWAHLIERIGRYDPDVVLFVGFTSPLVWALRADYPIVGMSLHATPPMAPVDVWLAADGGTQTPPDFWPDLPVPKPVRYPFRFWPASSRGTHERGVLGIGQDAVLLASSGYRLLTHAIAPGWMQDILAYLDTQPAVHWLLVGVRASLLPAVAALHPRLHCLPHQDDLASCLRMADIYLNPPRMGGGASVALAMDLGLPVLSLASSDGGDKLAELATTDTHVYMHRLAQWVADAQLRREAGAQLQRRFREQLDISQPQAGERLVTACRAAQACFRDRHHQGSSVTSVE